MTSVSRAKKHGQRSVAGAENHQAIARAHVDGIGVRRAAELVLLPAARSVLPGDACLVADRETLKAGFVDVGDGRLIRFRDGFLTQQIRSFVRGELHAAREKTERQSIERDADAIAIGRDLATVGVKLRRIATNFFGLARQIGGVSGRIAGDYQRRVPERVPFVGVDALRRGQMQQRQLMQLRVGKAALARGDLKFRRKIPGELEPHAVLGLRRKFQDDRLAILDSELRAEIGLVFALP